jgi:hypothetical protein
MSDYLVRKFYYGGFMGHVEDTLANFTAEFIGWTDDPGVGIFKCSDGRFRTIPEYAIAGDLPQIPKIDPERVITQGLLTDDEHPGYASVEEILELHEKCIRGQIGSVGGFFAAMAGVFSDEELDEELEEWEAYLEETDGE